jgi:hypothetical protein
MQRESHPLNFGAIFAGTVIALVIGIAITLFSGGFALATFRLERGEVPGEWMLIGVAAITAITSSFFGGYIATRLSHVDRRFDATMHALSTFALATILAIGLLGPSATLDTSALMAKAGVGPNGRTPNETLMEQLAQIKIVTDMKLLKGKAVTVFMPVRPEQQAQQVEKVEIEHAARRDSAHASFIALGMLLLGGVASLMGSRVAFGKLSA